MGWGEKSPRDGRKALLLSRTNEGMKGKEQERKTVQSMHDKATIASRTTDCDASVTQGHKQKAF